MKELFFFEKKRNKYTIKIYSVNKTPVTKPDKICGRSNEITPPINAPLKATAISRKKNICKLTSKVQQNKRN